VRSFPSRKDNRLPFDSVILLVVDDMHVCQQRDTCGNFINLKIYRSSLVLRRCSCKGVHVYYRIINRTKCALVYIYIYVCVPVARPGLLEKSNGSWHEDGGNPNLLFLCLAQTIRQIKIIIAY